MISSPIFEPIFIPLITKSGLNPSLNRLLIEIKMQSVGLHHQFYKNHLPQTILRGLSSVKECPQADLFLAGATTGDFCYWF